MGPETTCNTAICPVVAAAAGFACGAVLSAVICKLKCKGKNKECIAKKEQPSGQLPHGGVYPVAPKGSIEIYVGNLSYDMTDVELRKEFEAYGKVDDARIITNRFNGRSKGFGFVHMSNRAEVDAAVAALSNKEIRGRRMKVNESKNEDR